MNTVASTVGKFVWHEQVSSDPKQAQDFYTQLFRWDTEVFKPGELDYTMISSGGQSHGGFSKALEGAPPPHWLSHVRVENLAETIEKAKGAGGKLAAGPFEMAEVGRIAILTDPQGAFISAYQPEGEGPAAQGVFVWDELGTTDADEAQRFYGEVFGWTTTDMGSEYGGYRIFNRGAGDENGVAGLMALPDDSVPPHWQPYVAVDDPDATTAKAKELGGGALLEPTDVPKVGRLAVLRDPQGATFGIIRPDPAS
ncbi:MAG: VOC family protein [Actinobacteria bacterium]|nr:MAG: VOC family protein [Actinomycetota bacterium]